MATPTNWAFYTFLLIPFEGLDLNLIASTTGHSIKDIMTIIRGTI